jgi:glutamate/tyrosine decarboxylase-like PLP-dependent enzyme
MSINLFPSIFLTVSSILAVTGIGSDNVIGIQIDQGARVNVDALDKHLESCVQNEQAIYAVVAIIGSTEEGCVDPLFKIIQLRDKYQAQGLSFVVHADAAWGGYFATMLPKDMKLGDMLPLPLERSEGDGFVPDSSLRADTQTDLFALRFADSVTVDPHKAGYIPYPAGGLCYRDQRMRFLVTWSSPYITKEPTTTSIGIYGIKGR